MKIPAPSPRVLALVATAAAVLALGLAYHLGVVADLSDRVERVEARADRGVAALAALRAERLAPYGQTFADLGVEEPALAGDVRRLAARTGDLERQLSLVMLAVEGFRGRQPHADEEVADRLAALRADTDLLLEELLPGGPRLAPPPLDEEEAAAGEEAPEAGEEEPAEAVAEAAEPATGPEPASAPEPVWPRLQQEAERSWVRSASAMAGLDARQQERLEAIVRDVRARPAAIIDAVARGELGSQDARIQLRRIYEETERDLQQLLTGRQLDKLRRQLRVRAELWWDAALMGW